MLVDRRSVSLIIACLCCGVLPAKAACPSVEGNVARSYFLEGVQANIEYQNGLNLDAYAPPGVRRPAALVIHGSSGDKSTHLTQLFPLLAKAGYAWFSINYRNLADVRAAVVFIERPGRFPIEPHLLVIGEDT